MFKLKLTGVVFAFEKTYFYIRGVKFTVYTDQKVLENYD